MSLDTSKISKTDERNLAQAFLSAAKRFYEDPENVRETVRACARDIPCAPLFRSAR